VGDKIVLENSQGFTDETRSRITGPLLQAAPSIVGLDVNASEEVYSRFGLGSHGLISYLMVNHACLP
jgi:hypothetical protein